MRCGFLPQNDKEDTLRYDSRFEKMLAENGLSACTYHPSTPVPYTIKRNYEPDFIKGKFLIEAKGRFRDRNESNKYLWIRESLPKGKELVFVFQNENTPMPCSRRRKDGTRQTVGEWARKNGFLYYTPQTLPKRWSK